MSAPATARQGTDPKVVPLRLPELGDGQPGAGFIRRAVTLTLGTIATLAAAAVILSFLIKIDITVKSAGVLEPVKVWPVRAQAAAPVRQVLVSGGDTVAPGQVVVRLDALALETQLAQLRAQFRQAEIARDRAAAETPLEQRQQAERLSSARADLNTARANLLRTMVEHGFGTNVDSMLAVHRPGRHVMLDEAAGRVRSAEAQIRLSSAEGDKLDLRGYDRQSAQADMDRLSAQIRETEERIARTTLAAPSAGVVLTDQLEKLTGSYVREGDMLLEIGDLGDWRVTMMVPERDITKVRVGDLVRLEVQAFGQREREQMDGRVVHVASEASSPAGGEAPAGPGMFRVIASLDPAQVEAVDLERFRRGYSVRANVVTRSGRVAWLAWDWAMEKLKP